MEVRGRPEQGSPERRSELQAIFADERQFRPWYDLAARRAYAYLFGRCGGDASLAEELTQLTFMDALRHRDTYDGRADAITWLIAIGRNRLLDHLRRLRPMTWATSRTGIPSTVDRADPATARGERPDRGRAGRRNPPARSTTGKTVKRLETPLRRSIGTAPAGPRSARCRT